MDPPSEPAWALGASPQPGTLVSGFQALAMVWRAASNLSWKASTLGCQSGPNLGAWEEVGRIKGSWEIGLNIRGRGSMG